MAEPSPIVQVGGRRSSGSPPVDASPQDKGVVMDSVDVQIPLTDGTHAAASASHPAPMSVTGTSLFHLSFDANSTLFGVPLCKATTDECSATRAVVRRSMLKKIYLLEVQPPRNWFMI